MSTKNADPTEPIRTLAAALPDVVSGTSCTQSAFKTKSAFLFIGPQGGRYKAMFKLQKSMAQAEKLASKDPDSYQVGSTGWVTARFSADSPMPKKIWEKWLHESYELSVSAAAGKKSSAKKTAKKTAKKNATEKTKAAGPKRTTSPKRKTARKKK